MKLTLALAELLEYIETQADPELRVLAMRVETSLTAKLAPSVEPQQAVNTAKTRSNPRARTTPPTQAALTHQSL